MIQLTWTSENGRIMILALRGMVVMIDTMEKKCYAYTLDQMIRLIEEALRQ